MTDTKNNLPIPYAEFGSWLQTQLELLNRNQEAAASVFVNTITRRVADYGVSRPGTVTQVSDSATLIAPPPTEIRQIAWGACVDKPFRESVIWIEKELQLNANYLMACMKFESKLNPYARNPSSSASGLIQFMRDTAVSLGTTVERIQTMPAVQQLNYVYKYFARFQTQGYDLSKWTIDDTYMAILYPAAIQKADGFKLFVNDLSKNKDAYDVNKGLDVNHDQTITRREACERVRELLDEGMRPGNRG